MSRESTKKALEKFLTRESKPKRVTKNGRPEFEFKKIAKAWLEANGFSINVVESKAVWSNAAGGYVRGQTDAGFSDIVGVTPVRGVACFIELKAPGKRGTLKPHQRDFLLEKINKHAFAICTDSIEHMKNTFQVWRHVVESGEYYMAINMLTKDLPTTRARDAGVDGIPF